MRFNPLLAVGIVLVADRAGVAVFSGSCFGFRRESTALTAAHCCPVDASETQVLFPGLSPTPRPVVRIERHPTADVAALYFDGSEAVPDVDDYPEHAFWDHVANLGLGEEFEAYGFPTDGPAPDSSATAPTARMFRGHYQRFLEYPDHHGAHYLAGEMSIPAPAGLSGAPLFRPGAFQMVTGLVTANLDSYSITDSFEEVREGGSIYRLESRRIITYGVALILAGVEDWLLESIPPRHRRAR